jgi:hypothetical protein
MDLLHGEIRGTEASRIPPTPMTTSGLILTITAIQAALEAGNSGKCLSYSA